MERAVMTADNLYEIKPLNELESLAKRFAGEFTLFGGSVFRYLRARADDPTGSIDLFQISPFTADVDLLHSGGAELDGRIREAIQREVYAAECFRWRLRSIATHKKFFEPLQMRSGIIPVRLMMIDRVRVMDPWNGKSDIKESDYRYIRNGFRLIPSPRAYNDLEFFSAILFAQTLLEARLELHKLEKQKGIVEARASVASTHIQDALIALQEHARLRARLRYLLTANYAAAVTPAHRQRVFEILGLTTLLESIRNRDASLIDKVTTITPAVRLGDS
jgi:hypothetical protein